jgi:hypothetical protein
LSEYNNESNENCDCWQQGGGQVEFLKKDNSFNSKVLEFGQCGLSFLHHGLNFEHLSHWCLSILFDDTIGNSQSDDEPVKSSQSTSQHVRWEF